MADFIQEHREDGMTVRAPDTSYALHISDNPRVPDQHVLFTTGHRQYVTGRSVNEVLQSFPDLPLDPSLKYIEVGPGLGELLPMVAGAALQEEGQKHIAIDPADYNLMQIMLQHAYQIAPQHAQSKNYRDHIGALLERCQIILDPHKVQLINSTLQAAMADSALASTLRGTGDVVVDHVGALYYANPNQATVRDDINKVLTLEESLMKPDGRFFAK